MNNTFKRKTRAKTYFSSDFGTFVLVVTSHNFTVESAEPDARSDPSQLNIDKNSLIDSYLHTHTITTIWRWEQRIYLKASDQTQDVCPIRGVTQRPLERSHIIIVPSSSPDAMYRPSGDIAKDKIILLWPMKILTHSPLWRSHRRTVLSLDPVAI